MKNCKICVISRRIKFTLLPNINFISFSLNFKIISLFIILFFALNKKNRTKFSHFWQFIMTQKFSKCNLCSI